MELLQDVLLKIRSCCFKTMKNKFFDLQAKHKQKINRYMMTIFFII